MKSSISLLFIIFGISLSLISSIFLLKTLSIANIAKLTSAVCDDGVCRIETTDKVSLKDKFKQLGKEFKQEASVNQIQTTSNEITQNQDEKPLIDNLKIPVNPNNSSNPNYPIYNNNDSISESIEQIVNLGWSKVEAESALKINNYSIENTIDYLETEDLNKQKLKEAVNEIYNKHYFSREISEIILLENDLNITKSVYLLEQEEQKLKEQFDISVADLISNGWEEAIARRALLSQWIFEQRKVGGFNDTLTRTELDLIRPTLRRQNETEIKSKTQTKPQIKSQTSNSTPKSKSSSPEPIRAKREDCIFEVTTQNFQKIVLESKVPVLLDLYATWCGPCKQLTPILEEAAMKTGGMFRLAKVNVDDNRDIVDAMDATGFPTVFAVNNGKFTDKFVGLLSNDDINKFLSRAVTGYGARVQGNQITDEELSIITNKMNNLAGLASITFKKKEKLYYLISEALNLEGAWINNNKINNSIKLVIKYIDNLINDIRNIKYRKIQLNSKSYKELIDNSLAAKELLKISGFQFNETTNNLILSHYNTAILNLIKLRIYEIEKQRKFPLKPVTPTMSPTNSPTNVPISESNKDLTEITVYLKNNKNDNKIIKKQFKSNQLIENILKELFESNPIIDLLEIKFPLPRKLLTKDLYRYVTLLLIPLIDQLI